MRLDVNIPWKWDERLVLAALWRRGLSASKIAAELPGRTKNAVIGKARRIGLDPRPSPIAGRGASSEA